LLNEPPAADDLAGLRAQFPGVPLWFGLHTRMFWALVQVAGSPRLVEAITPQELATAIRRPWLWPWPVQ
jgi:hypothetical protein